MTSAGNHGAHSVLADPVRRSVIERLGLSGHLADADLDDIVSTVIAACRVPSAAITIVTPDLQTNPAERGIGSPSTHILDALSFSAAVVRTDQLVMVADAQAHEVYARNPRVQSGTVRAYAGAPIRFQGHVIGALSMFDDTPREFTLPELKVLNSQARLVCAILQLRVLSARAEAAGQADERFISSQATVDAAELRQAMSDGQLVMHYQPVLQLNSNVVLKVEALVRWHHPSRGTVPPLEFIPLAEKSPELMAGLGDWILRTCTEQLAAWRRAGRDLHVAINVSPVQLADPDFPRRVSSILADAGVPADRIIFEVTESALLDQPLATTSLTHLHENGIRLALDDFGTGYSSYSYLRRFPIDILKIDRSFVAGLGQFADDAAIIASVMGLARDTDKMVIAEGVETVDQLALLMAQGVRYAQGYLWSPPLPAVQLETWLDGFASRDRLGTDLPADPSAATREVHVTTWAPVTLSSRRFTGLVPTLSTAVLDAG